MELIHTCYRITDPDRSVAFYEALGFEKRRELPIRDEAINIFMGLPGDDERLELTYNFGVDSYELGTGYGHIAAAVHRARGWLAALLRSRSGRLPGRADRALTTLNEVGRSALLAGGPAGVRVSAISGVEAASVEARPRIAMV